MHHERQSPNDRRFGRRQLEWTQRNRGRRSRCQTLGPLTVELEGVNWGANRHATHIYEAICEVVDGRFCRQCRLGRITGGEVVILVQTTADVYDIKGAWHDLIRDHMKQVCPHLRGRRLTFRPVGRDEWERGVVFVVP